LNTKPLQHGGVVSPSFGHHLVRVRGRVTRGGAPVARVAFRRLMPGDLYRDDGGEWLVQAVTDADGQFETLLATSPQTFMVETLDGKRKYGVHTLAVPDEDDARVDLSLPMGTTVAAVVRDKATGKAIPQPLVEFRRSSDKLARPTRIRSGADGRVTLDLDADDYIVSAAAAGYEPATLEVGVSGTKRFDLNVELAPAAFISGRLADCDPNEGLFAEIVVVSEDGLERADLLPSDGCAFRSGRLTREIYSVVGGNEVRGWGVVTGIAAGTTDLQLAMVEPGRLDLTVQGADGQIQPGTLATVSLVDGARVVVPYLGDQTGRPDPLYGRVADRAGRIQLAVPAGRLTIDLLSHKYKGRLEIDVPPGATITRPITLSDRR